MAPTSLGIDYQLSVLAHLAKYDRLADIHADARANGTEREFGELVDAAICLLREAKHVADTPPHHQRRSGRLGSLMTSTGHGA